MSDLLDEVIAAEKAHTASSMEIRLGMEVSNLRSRNALLDRLVHRYEGEINGMVAQDRRLRDALEQAQSCLMGETPEDGMSHEDARDDTLEKIRKALNHV